MFEFSQEMLSLLGQVHVNVPWRMLPDYLQKVLRHRVNVEIGFEGRDLDRASRSDLKSAARQLADAGCRVTLHGPFWDLNPGSIDPLIGQMSRFRLQQFLDLADIFRPVRMVCHTGYDPRHHHAQRQVWLERSLEAWEPLVRRAEAFHVPLLIENVWEYDPYLHRELLDAVGSSYFGFCLDVGHQHSFSRTNLEGWLHALSGFLKEIHLHDNDGSADAHLPIGRGNIDFALLFGFLKEQEEAPVLTLEPHREEHLGESLKGLLDVMEKSAFSTP